LEEGRRSSGWAGKKGGIRTQHLRGPSGKELRVADKKTVDYVEVRHSEMARSIAIDTKKL